MPPPAGDVEYMGLRFEPRVKLLEAVTEPGQSMFDTSSQRFKLEVDWIKALPGGSETDFVLVSCAGAPRPGAKALSLALPAWAGLGWAALWCGVLMG